MCCDLLSTPQLSAVTPVCAGAVPEATPEERSSTVFRSGNERLYEAYNDLHSLAQDFEKPFDAPAILVVGHQTDGKSGGDAVGPGCCRAYTEAPHNICSGACPPCLKLSAAGIRHSMQAPLLWAACRVDEGKWLLRPICLANAVHMQQPH